MRLGGNDLRHLATGAVFLGAGGGGDRYLGRLLARLAIDEFGAPELCAPPGTGRRRQGAHHRHAWRPDASGHFHLNR